MIGEFVRELAVLIIVFVPLEAYKGNHWEWWQLLLAMLGTIGFAVGILALGIRIERRRP
jgi:hypothetical protein